MYALVKSLYFPDVIVWIWVVISDSSNVTTSKTSNLLFVKYTTSRESEFSAPDGFLTTLATILPFWEIIFSPTIALFWILTVLLKDNFSKTGADVSKDSKIPIIFTASG